jgi:hypothetical protein
MKTTNLRFSLAMTPTGDGDRLFQFSDPQHLYGYCACPATLADEQITAGQNFQYHITVLHPDGCEPPMENCVLLTNYVFYLDELIAFIRDTDGQIISIERLTNENKPY